jgi:hypothetical protein
MPCSRTTQPKRSRQQSKQASRRCSSYSFPAIETPSARLASDLIHIDSMLLEQPLQSRVSFYRRFPSPAQRADVSAQWRRKQINKNHKSVPQIEFLTCTTCFRIGLASTPCSLRSHTSHESTFADVTITRPMTSAQRAGTSHASARDRMSCREQTDVVILRFSGCRTVGSSARVD